MNPASCEALKRESISELLGRLADSSAALVRDEIELVKQQGREKLKDLRNGIIMASIGLVFVLGACGSIFAAFAIWLSRIMPPGSAAATNALALAVIGGILLYLGIRQLKKPVP